MRKRWLRRVVEAVAAVAVLILVFDNRASEIDGLVMLGSFAVLVACVLAWRKFGDDHEIVPKDPEQ